MNALKALPPTKPYPMPFVRVEIALMSVFEGRLVVLVGRRAEAPYAGRWALPGGVLRIDLDANLEGAAARVVRERLDVELPGLRQLCAVGGPKRDPRAPWTLAVVYRAFVPFESLAPSPGKRLEGLEWRPVEEAMADARLAFDHAALIALATHEVRAEIEQLDLPFDFLSSSFTLTELQQTCESILGRRLDKSSFRRRLAERGVLAPIAGQLKGGAFRPAQLYRRRAASS
jgi:ADP-ribose pyrophosphatase YjhB (NUDIX family)